MLGMQRCAIGGVPSGQFGKKVVSCQSERSLGVYELGNEWAHGFLSKISDRTSLHDSALIHENDFVAEIGGFRQIVSY